MKAAPVSADDRLVDAERLVRIVSVSIAGVTLGLALWAEGPHRLWAAAGCGILVLLSLLPRRLSQWCFLLTTLSGYLLLETGLRVAPDQKYLFVLLFYSMLIVSATRLSWPLILTGIGVEALVRVGVFEDLSHVYRLVHPYTITDAAGILMLAGVVKELVEGQRRIEALNRLLHRQATTDELTGVASRREIMAQFEQAVTGAALHRGVCSIVLIDLDRFKCYNDLLGHQAGDQVLQKVGEVMLACLPPGCVAGRYGGDEFLVILPGYERAGAAKWGSELVRGLAEHRFHRPHGHPVPIGASVGIAACPDDGEDASSLLVAADKELYACKGTRSQEPCEGQTPA